MTPNFWMLYWPHFRGSNRARFVSWEQSTASLEKQRGVIVLVIMHKNWIMLPRKTASILIPTHSANHFMLIHTCYGGGEVKWIYASDHYSEGQSVFDMEKRDWVWTAQRMLAVLVKDHRSDRSRPSDPWWTPVIHNKHHTWPALHREQLEWDAAQKGKKRS